MGLEELLKADESKQKALERMLLQEEAKIKKEQNEARFRDHLEQTAKIDSTVDMAIKNGIIKEIIDSRPELVQSINDPKAALDAVLRAAEDKMALKAALEAKEKMEQSYKSQQQQPESQKADASVRPSTQTSVSSEGTVFDHNNPEHVKELLSAGYSKAQIGMIAAFSSRHRVKPEWEIRQ